MMSDTTTQDPTLTRVLSVIHRTIFTPVADIRPEHSLRKDVHCDDIDLMSIAVECEEEFGIEITDEMTEKWSLVSDVVDTVRSVDHG